MKKQKQSVKIPNFLKTGQHAITKRTDRPSVPINLEEKKLKDLSGERWKNTERSTIPKKKKPSSGRLNVLKNCIYQYSPEYASSMTDYIVSLCAESKYQEVLEYTQAVEIPHEDTGVTEGVIAFSQQVTSTGKIKNSVEKEIKGKKCAVLKNLAK